MIMVSFAVIGGDVRQLRLAEMLRLDGSRVNIACFDTETEYHNKCMCYEDAMRISDCAVLPVPSFTRDGCLSTPYSDDKIPMDRLLELVRPGMLIVGGMLSAEFKSAVVEKGAYCEDILARDDFVISNAVPAAEGAIQIAMEELPITIAGSKCLIAGAGRIGKQLAIRLHTLGADVTVTARKPSDLAFCEAFGVAAEDTARLSYLVPGNDVIFNMIPKRLFCGEVLDRIDKGCLCVDLASEPGGFDREEAEKRGIKVIHALSLPGKVAPVTAARNLKKVILRILAEQEKAGRLCCPGKG